MVRALPLLVVFTLQAGQVELPTRAEVLGGLGAAVGMCGAAFLGAGSSMTTDDGRGTALVVGGAGLAAFGVSLIVLALVTWVWPHDWTGVFSGSPPR